MRGLWQALCGAVAAAAAIHAGGSWAQATSTGPRPEADPFTLRLAQGERTRALEGSGQAYPIKPIRVIVGFAPSGGTDVAARTLGQKLAETLGQSIVVDNRPGAGGTIGDALAATAAPDGYTLLMTANGPHAIAPSLYASLPYNIFRDYASISLVTTNPYVLVVHPSMAATNMAGRNSRRSTGPCRRQ